MVPVIGGLPRRPDAETRHRVAAATSPRKLSTIRVDEESKRDPEIQELYQLVETGSPVEAEEWPRHLKCYHRRGAEYYTLNHSVLMNQRLVIPRALRLEALALLHSCHSGVRGIEAMFWPGMTTDIQRTHDDCESCRTTALPAAQTTASTRLPLPDGVL